MIELYSDNKAIADTQIPGAGGDPRSMLDEIGTKMHGSLNGLYYYYLEQGLFSTTVGQYTYDNTKVLGTTEAIFSICLAPFLNIQAGDLKRKVFDTDRFGTVEVKDKIAVNNAPYLFRIKSNTPIRTLDIADAKVYNVKKPSGFPVKRDPEFESKLQEYPYRSIIFGSNVFDMVEIIPRYCRDNAEFKSTGKVILQACTPVSPNGNFFLQVKGKYKGDDGVLERIYSTNSFDMPNTSSAYSNYVSTQKAQTNWGMLTSSLSGVSNALPGIALAGANTADSLRNWTAAGWDTKANVKDVMKGPLMVAGVGAGLQAATTIASELAQVQDIKSTPNSLKSSGSDVSVRLGFADSGSPKTTVMATEKIMNSTARERIGNYFHLYGYAQNREMKINLRSRHFYNYIKTVGANVKGKGKYSEAIPKMYLEEIKRVFDNGVTFWHVDRRQVTMYDYQYDNTEISITGGN